MTQPSWKRLTAVLTCLGLAAWLLLLAPTMAPAQGETRDAAPATTLVRQPFLWRIERTPPSYMFGTIHLPDERTNVPAPSAMAALLAADEVLTEIPMDLVTMARSATAFLRSDGRQLRDVLPPELHARFQNYVRSKGRDPNIFENMKTWAATIQLASLEYMDKMQTTPPLDMKVYFEGLRNGKQVGGIETIDEQLAVFENFNEEEQVQLLGSSLDMMEAMEKDGQNPTEVMVDLYLGGDLDRLVEVLMEQYDADDPLQRRFLFYLNEHRNLKMRDRMIARMNENPGRSYFFAIGTLHFHGEQGLVRLLEKEGFRITRILDPINLPEPPKAP